MTEPPEYQVGHVINISGLNPWLFPSQSQPTFVHRELQKHVEQFLAGLVHGLLVIRMIVSRPTNWLRLKLLDGSTICA